MSEKLNNVLSPERIDNARKRIAKCLNMLEVTTQEVHWACESEQWNDEVGDDTPMYYNTPIEECVDWVVHYLDGRKERG